MGIYDFTVLDWEGKAVALADYRGKALLVVNTATRCGFTPQYKGLQELYDKYRDKGLEILDFPCNQFLRQAPGSNKEIHEFCELKYHIRFGQFDKIEVNGKNEAPLYTFLKKERGEGAKIKWNFTKFLVNKVGTVTNRFESRVKPQDIEADIEALLAE
ncbi:MAG: glutathione peroxidase [Clostridiales bacterium]|jgi:glutathione peroxidase|nr:glutathione peroxidase [Clostridiales bacterium]